MRLALLDHDHRAAPSRALPRMKGEHSRNVPKPESQKMIFAPNCSWRGLLAVLFALPKLDRFEMSLPGVPRITVLNILKASARNSMRRPSPQNGNWRKIEVSRFQNLGERNASRPLFPKVNIAGVAKAVILNTQLTLPTGPAGMSFLAGHDPLFGSPTRLARSYCAQETLPVFAKSLAP